jgi:hypothetical protein
MIGPRHPFVPDRRVAVAAGVVLFLAGSWFLYDAWEGRGLKTPRIARPFTWF